MRYTPNGSAVTEFRIASNRRYTTRDGEARDETEWFRVITWNKLAEICSQYLQKGPPGLRRGAFADPLMGGPGRRHPLHHRSHRPGSQVPRRPSRRRWRAHGWRSRGTSDGWRSRGTSDGWRSRGTSDGWRRPSGRPRTRRPPVLTQGTAGRASAPGRTERQRIDVDLRRYPLLSSHGRKHLTLQRQCA